MERREIFKYLGLGLLGSLSSNSVLHAVDNKNPDIHLPKDNIEPEHIERFVKDYVDSKMTLTIDGRDLVGVLDKNK